MSAVDWLTDDDDLVEMFDDAEAAADEAARRAKHGAPWGEGKTDAEIEAEVERRMAAWQAERNAKAARYPAMTTEEKNAEFKADLQALRAREAEVDAKWTGTPRATGPRLGQLAAEEVEHLLASSDLDARAERKRQLAEGVAQLAAEDPAERDYFAASEAYARDPWSMAVREEHLRASAAYWTPERLAAINDEYGAFAEAIRSDIYDKAVFEADNAFWHVLAPAEEREAMPPEQREQDDHEKAVQKEVERLRVQEEARKRLAEDEVAKSLRSWEPVPFDDILDKIAAGTLDLPKPEVGMVTGTDLGLFYRGRVNGIAGESGGGKGWIALRTALEQMKLGRDFYYVDFEDSPELALLRLVKGFGADPALLKERMHYIHPEEHNLAEIQRLAEAVSLTPDAFVAIDSTGESIAQSGRVQNNDDEVAAWFQELPHALSRAGATVVLIDHLVKSPEGGLWPAGSHRKRAAITGAQYVLEVAEAPSVENDGLVILKVAKDRGGARSAGSAASFVRFTHDPFSGKLRVTFDPGKTTEELKAEKAARAAAAAAAQLAEDVDTLRSLVPPPSSQRDVKDRLGWGSTRAADALREFRSEVSS